MPTFSERRKLKIKNHKAKIFTVFTYPLVEEFPALASALPHPVYLKGEGITTMWLYRVL